jgi:SAM-dependent methyltransferase
MSHSNQVLPSLPSEGEVENAVLIGRDGWLFLWGGANEVSKYYTEPGFFSDATMDSWRQLIAHRKAICEGLGARYVHLVAPDKLSVFPEHVTRPLPFFDTIPSKRFAHEFLGSENYLDVLKAIAEGPDRDISYYKTDTHWTASGAQTAYIALCKMLGVNPVDFSDRGISGGEILFDLGQKLVAQPKERGRFCMVLRNAKRVAENEFVRFNEAPLPRIGAAKLVGSYACFYNDGPEANPQRVVIFGDSFSEYRPYLLTGMLAETFREVHFVWSTSIDVGFVERVRPDIVITEIAERFVNLVPNDQFRLVIDNLVPSNHVSHYLSQRPSHAQRNPMLVVYEKIFASAAESSSALRQLPIDDYGLMLLNAPAVGLPRMPEDQIQKNWNGSSGLELLRQSVMNVRLFEGAYVRTRNQSLAGKRILDIGCGWGRLTRLFLKYSDDVFAVDPWTRSIEEFKACGMTSPVAQSDYLPESFPFDNIDLAYAFSVFTHTSLRASEALLRAARRSIAPTGVFVFTIRPVEFWSYADNYKADPQAFINSHNVDGYAYAPQPGNAGSADYGDTSIEVGFLSKLLASTGWEMVGLDRSMTDPYQLFVIATPKVQSDMDEVSFVD